MPSAEIILEGITWDHPRGYDPLVAAAETYCAQTDIRVNWTRRSLQAFADQSISDLAQNYDLIVLDHPHIGLVAQDQSVLALPHAPNMGATVGHSAESYVWNGDVYAYAIDAACQMSVHREDHVGPFPKFWHEFLKEDVRSFKALTPLKPVDAFDMWLTLCASFGSENMPVSKDCFMPESPGLFGLDVLKCLYRCGPQEAVDWNPIHVLEQLSNSAQTDFSYSPCLFGYQTYTAAHPGRYRLIYRDLPVFEQGNQRRSILGGAGIAVSSSSKQIDAAIQHALWLASDEIQIGVYSDNNGQPANQKAWDLLSNKPLLSDFYCGASDTMKTAWTRPRDPWFLGFVDEVCDAFPDFFRRDIGEDKFLSTINAIYRKHRPIKSQERY